MSNVDHRGLEIVKEWDAERFRQKLDTPIAVGPEKAAELVGRSRSRIFKAIKEGELTARKDGKATIIEYTELQRWVRAFPRIGRFED